jgi:hypothetical protein
MLDIESRVGIESLDALLHARAELVQKAASYYALYGPFGTAEHRRKVALALAELQARSDFAAVGEKVTEGKVEAVARTHPTYLKYLDEMEAGRAQWLLIETELQSITDKIHRGNHLTRYAATEPR